MAFSTNPQRVLGCDVGKDAVVVCDSQSGEIRTVANTPAALEAALDRLDAGVLVVCEATGGYEAALLTAAHAHGLAAHRADPRKAHAFARSLNSHAKTDAIDAEALARYGLERGAELLPWRPPPAAQATLTGLVQFRADLVQTRADYRRRLKAPGGEAAKAHLQDLIAAFDARVAAVEADIAETIEADAGLSQTVAVIEAIPGCGTKTAHTLAALMPELGRINRRQATALAGLAPHPNQSGRSDAYRRAKGGRTAVKSALFLAAMAARRHNPDLRAHYNHLRDQGKKPIVAIIAIARKLITVINARIRDAVCEKNAELC